jgi:hypothetical protein
MRSAPLRATSTNWRASPFDAETWQEYLAGHLGEPIRNFGVGGYGVYQAYRRMIREERTNHGADNLILYIWGDDHIRSLLRCRHAIIYKRWSHRGGTMFHANFWAHLEMNLETSRFVEKENPLDTPGALYRMTEQRFMVDNLKDDLALQLYANAMEYTRELDRGVPRVGSRLQRVSLNSTGRVSDEKCQIDVGDRATRNPVVVTDCSLQVHTRRADVAHLKRHAVA